MSFYVKLLITLEVDLSEQYKIKISQFMTTLKYILEYKV